MLLKSVLLIGFTTSCQSGTGMNAYNNLANTLESRSGTDGLVSFPPFLSISFALSIFRLIADLGLPKASSSRLKTPFSHGNNSGFGAKEVNLILSYILRSKNA